MYVHDIGQHTLHVGSFPNSINFIMRDITCDLKDNFKPQFKLGLLIFYYPHVHFNELEAIIPFLMSREIQPKCNQHHFQSEILLMFLSCVIWRSVHEKVGNMLMTTSDLSKGSCHRSMILFISLFLYFLHLKFFEVT